MCSVKRLRRSMDRTKVSGTLDVGSIPAGAIDNLISQVASLRLRDFCLSGLMWQRALVLTVFFLALGG